MHIEQEECPGSDPRTLDAQDRGTDQDVIRLPAAVAVGIQPQVPAVVHSPGT